MPVSPAAVVRAADCQPGWKTPSRVRLRNVPVVAGGCWPKRFHYMAARTVRRWVASGSAGVASTRVLRVRSWHK